MVKRVMWNMPKPETRWRRKSDGRVDTAKSNDGSMHILMYSPETNRHWHIQVQNFYRKYEAVGE